MLKKLSLSLMVLTIIIGFFIFRDQQHHTLGTYMGPQDTTTTIMTYNILMGLNDADRREAFVDYMNNSDVDVLALEELNGMKEKDLLTLGKSFGHAYAVQLKTSGYPVGITSKYPIELVDKLRFGYHHGALHVRIQGTHYIVVHLSPLSAKKRTEEVQRLMDYLDHYELLDNEDLVILGDFNAHSSADKTYLDESDLSSHYDTKNLVNGQLSFETLALLEEAGFTDAYLKGCDEVERVYATYPVDAYEELGERIDFIFLSPSLSTSVSHSRIDINDLTKQISDHFPVITTLDF